MVISGNATTDRTALRAIAPLTQARPKPVLNLLVAQGVVGPDRQGHYALLRPDLERADLERLTRSSRERDEADRAKLEQVVA